MPKFPGFQTGTAQTILQQSQLGEQAASRRQRAAETRQRGIIAGIQLGLQGVGVGADVFGGVQQRGLQEQLADRRERGLFTRQAADIDAAKAIEKSRAAAQIDAAKIRGNLANIGLPGSRARAAAGSDELVTIAGDEAAAVDVLDRKLKSKTGKVPDEFGLDAIKALKDPSGAALNEDLFSKQSLRGLPQEQVLQNISLALSENPDAQRAEEILAAINLLLGSEEGPLLDRFDVLDEGLLGQQLPAPRSIERPEFSPSGAVRFGDFSPGTAGPFLKEKAGPVEVRNQEVDDLLQVLDFLRQVDAQEQLGTTPQLSPEILDRILQTNSFLEGRGARIDEAALEEAIRRRQTSRTGTSITGRRE
jgi:hypothetical protein